MITLEELGSNIRQIREKLGFSQGHVAEHLGLNRQAIISIEAGKRKIDSFELFKLADLFGVDAKELLTKEEIRFSRFEDAVLHLRKKERLTDKERQALIEFQQICEDYEFLKKL
jgi:transcriptional regulator with XRE-family HTH domain